MTRRSLALLLLAATVTGPATAQTPRPLTLTLELADPGTGPAFVLRAVVRVESGWHVNSDRPLQDFLIPTRLTLTPPSGWRVLEVRYPPALRRRFAFAGDEELSVWEGETVIEARLARATPGARGEVRAELRYQACNDRVCLPPSTVGAAVTARTPPR